MSSNTPVAQDDHLYRHKGSFFLKKWTTPEFIDSLQDFKIRDDDIFLITYPKSGTIWTQQVLSLICSDGHRNGTENINTSDRVPFIEFPQSCDVTDYNNRCSPRLFASHLPNEFVPQGLKNKKAKVIYVMRNPKDVVKSFYHFQAMVVDAQKSPDFNHFFEKFLNGHVYPGRWFDHIKGWYMNKDDYNILLIKYEDMIKDLHSVVIQICAFLGMELNEEAIDIVIRKASFNEMKMDPLANKKDFSGGTLDLNLGTFVRKGAVGDWKNIMTVAQSETFDKIYQEEMEGLSLDFTWDATEWIENK
ncbi:amine sulfotransferase-like [Hyperolius riggenbachi]|uniref:amine sulfotransferase-like n=1 Tax=Hyperolius riggenbachi TaxID=752182 RepID=UPI0035A336A2